jgi:cholest-4-en-3-one 26-monooxygenase
MQRFAFVIEGYRHCPTVTTVHRIVEAEEQVEILGRSHTLRAGDEVAYAFVCINRDPRVFAAPDEFRIDRPPDEAANVLSWSAGPHVCPAKDLSIVSTVLMLDTLAATRGDLRRIRIFNLEF